MVSNLEEFRQVEIERLRDHLAFARRRGHHELAEHLQKKLALLECPPAVPWWRRILERLASI